MVMSKGRFVGKGLLMLVAVAVLGGLVMLLWNAVVPELFAGARSIDYLHALGLLVLCRILFGGFRGYGGWHGRRHWGRWSAMTPEEREQVRRGGPWGGREGRGAGHAE
jgi:hypothetical protein